MTNYSNSSNNPFTLFLPKLKPDCDVGAGSDSGVWVVHRATAFQNVASSLNYSAPGELKSISSVPTMWARPLTMEMALHDQAHPIRSQMVEQWQGMLTAVALAESRGFPLKAELVELEKTRYDLFARSLYELLPDPINTLYRDSGKHPWQDLYVFLWNDSPVGITTPSTLVVPSEEGNWEGLPWWRDGRLYAPHTELNPNERALLWRWLENLSVQLQRHNGNSRAINTIVGLIGEFRASLLREPPEQPLSLTEEPQFFGVPLNRGVLIGLNYPVKAPPKPSSVKLVPSRDKQPALDLLLVDPAIADQWNELPQNVWVHDGKTLASLKTEDLHTGRMVWKDVRWLESNQLFLPQLTFIDHKSDAFPGALMPDERQPLTLAGERITPLIPLNPILLDYLTPEELRNRLKFQPVLGGQEPIVQVILDLPLSGTKEGAESVNYRLTKEYPLKKENALSEVPILDIWPNFRSPKWKEYYAFYYDGEYGQETFQVEFPESQEVSPFKDVRGGNYQTVRLEQFPTVIKCQNEANMPLGLILLKQPPEVNPNDSWKVGVDFGTSFTNVYISRSGEAELLSLESLHLKVTDAPLDTRFSVLFEYFIPENFIPNDKPLPLSSVLTALGSGQATLSQNGRPIFDGRMYIPNLARFDPKATWIHTDLKWTNFSANRLFIKHLALHISAIAVKNGINQIQWSLSFPSAFSRNDCNGYIKNWRDLTQNLQQKTGVTYHCPDSIDSEYFRTESLSIAQYFADFERHDLVFTTCIDMGGGTSDISIWERNKLVHQCSVQLAGRDLLSHFLELKPHFIEKYFKVNPKDWQGLRGESFHAKLAVLLRWESERWLREDRPTLLNEEEFQGLIRLTTIGLAGLYYYVGTLLRVLYDEDKYKREEITPVYIGGNGSRLLHWLDSTGQFTRDSEINDLLSRMLSRGSGFSDTEVTTRLSRNPKDEVACGLVLDHSKLEGLKRKTKDPVIAGETFELNGMKLFWNSRVDIEEDVQSFRMPSFDRLSEFLYEFHLALKELQIEEIRPLKDYKLSKSPSDNDKLWRSTQRSLENLLQTINFSGEAGRIRVEPPFILGLKALLHHLGNEWSGR